MSLDYETHNAESMMVAFQEWERLTLGEFEQLANALDDPYGNWRDFLINYFFETCKKELAA